MRLYLIRHAESQGNFEMRLQGTKEFPLTERGRDQAGALAKRIADFGIEAIYSSPLQRTMQTAEIIGGWSGLGIVPEPRLKEYDFGEIISGLTWEDIRKEHPSIIQALSKEDSQFPRYPGEEGRAAFRDRVCQAMDEIAERHSEARGVAVVTHAGPIVAYVLETLGRSYGRPVPFAIDNASITIVEVGASRAFAPAVLTSVNDACHVRDNLRKHARFTEDIEPQR